MVLEVEGLMTSYALFIAVMLSLPSTRWSHSITCQFLEYWAKHYPKGA